MSVNELHYEREKVYWDVRGTEDYASLSTSDRDRITGWIGWQGAGRILDIGGGAGMVSRLVADSPATDVVCLDISHAMLGHSPVPAVQADATRLPLASGSFDLVVGAAFLHHLPDLHREVLSECHRVLRPGGRMVGYDPNGTSVQNRVFMGTGRLRLKRFTPDELPIVPAELSRAALDAGFSAFGFELFTFHNDSGSAFETIQTRLLNPVAKGPLRRYLERWFFWAAVK